jgi:alpha-1,3-rhamnosyl/mannosyltransferase
MRIGVDARKLWDGGIGTYIRNLLSAALERPRGHEFVVFLDPVDMGRISWPGTAAEEVSVKAGKYSLLEHWVLPHAARRAGVGLFHAPHYTLPLGWSGPSVVTIHDLTHVRYAHFYPPGAGIYARALAGAAARRAQFVIADSAATGADVVELLHIPEERVRVIALGIASGIARRPAEEVAAFTRERALPEGYLLYVGARKRHKNLELLIRALSALRADDRPALVLSGPPWTSEHRLARLAQACGVAPMIHFAGDLRDERELSCLYSGASLYLQPSLIEGFGLPPLEAMACGVPVIASRVDALRETLGNAAVLLDPHDIEAWAGVIASLPADSEHRTTLVRRGRERAQAFTWERTAGLTLDVYDEALEGGSIRGTVSG